MTDAPLSQSVARRRCSCGRLATVHLNASMPFPEHSVCIRCYTTGMSPEDAAEVRARHREEARDA